MSHPPESSSLKKKKKTSHYGSADDSSPQKKKKKADKRVPDKENTAELETSTAASAVVPASTGRHYTVSVALPGSIIANAQTPELQSNLAAQIARALAVFSVDEIVIFDETTAQKHTPQNNPNEFLGRILQYLETPQYLRKSFFQHHPHLRFAGLLNPLDSPHHMRMDDVMEYREGIVLNRPARAGSLVNCGMRKEVRIDKVIVPGTRVTVRLNADSKPDASVVLGTVVPPSEPRTAKGIYWGYNTRFAEKLSAVFTGCPYKGGYDLTVGTSERGESVDTSAKLPEFKHILIVFGGVRGLEYSLESDESLLVNDVSELFQRYYNTCPTQGSRTIRTEEAILISMAALRPKIAESGYRPGS